MQAIARALGAEKFQWHVAAGYREWDYADATGKVVGTVRNQTAYANGALIGRYVSVEQAKAAVEAEVRRVR
jgi:hypothetical protein